ncbi:MAG: DUF4230 domain-containing protein [Candidatus Sericytochromatia bacterium]
MARLPAQVHKLLLIALVLVAAGLIWQLKPGPWERQSQILITRLQAVQKLEVLEARLLAHQSISDPALLNTNEFLIVAKAKAIYGIDLSRAEVHADGPKVRLALPPVRLFDLVMNPDDIEFLGLKKGLLTTQQDFEERKRQAGVALQAELTRQSGDPELIKQAETNARQYLQSLLTSLGFEQVEIEFGDRPAVHDKL